MFDSISTVHGPSSFLPFLDLIYMIFALQPRARLFCFWAHSRLVRLRIIPTGEPRGETTRLTTIWIFQILTNFIEYFPLSSLLASSENCVASAVVCHTFTSIVKGTQLTPSNFVANSLVFNLFICVVLSSSSQSLLLLTTEWCAVLSQCCRSLLQSFLDLLG